VPPDLHHKILDILARHNNMTIATLRVDGFPQATTVGYASDGLTIYFGCAPQSQKAHNIARDPRVSAAIDEDHQNWNEIEGLSLAGIATHVTDVAELAKVESLFAAKFPQMRAFSADDLARLIVFRVAPSVISVLDYSKGFGHSDLVTV
jgi:general stress protein 26